MAIKHWKLDHKKHRIKHWILDGTRQVRWDIKSCPILPRVNPMILKRLKWADIWPVCPLFYSRKRLLMGWYLTRMWHTGQISAHLSRFVNTVCPPFYSSQNGSKWAGIWPVCPPLMQCSVFTLPFQCGVQYLLFLFIAVFCTYHFFSLWYSAFNLPFHCGVQYFLFLFIAVFPLL